MDDELYRLKMKSQMLCDRLTNDLAQNKDDTHQFFGGEIYRAYIAASDQAMEKTRRIRTKIRNIQ